MELERSFINLNRQKGTALSQITLEEDLNVPDQKADIFKIIHGQGEFCPDEIKGETGKIKVRGVFVYRILYIGEDQNRMPEVLEGSIPVDETVFLNELEEGDVLDFHWKQEDLHISEIHSRKANIKVILSMQGEAYREQPVPLVSEVTESEDLLMRRSPVQLQQEIIHKKDTIRVREDMNLPPGKPNVQRILWKEIRLQGAETRLEDGRIQVKGELMVFFLYESEEEGRLQWLEQSIPFRNDVECELSRTGLSGMTEVTLLKGEAELQADYDGEPRTIRIDVVLELLMRYFEDSICDVLQDAYSLSKEITPIRKEYQWDHILQVSDSRARVSARPTIGEADPDMMQILCVGGQVHSDYTEVSAQGLKMQGNVELWVLYATEDDAQPFACSTYSIPYEHTAELRETSEGRWQLRMSMDQLTVSMISARELEVKAMLQVQVLLGKQETLGLVEDLEEAPLDMERLRILPGIVVHVVQPEETLWEISKMHSTTCQAVMELNGLKEENVKPGVRLLLVKKMAEKTIVSASKID